MRRLVVPEVVQTSNMDCGPASLKCLLEGFGIAVSYGRLREACQTDVDGTSIDTLEEIAKQLGLEAEQVMVPLDHLLLPESDTLPALLVVRLPNGFTHFVVVWRRHGPFVQVMDPGTGRRWTRASKLLEETYVHQTAVPAEGFLEWARSDDFLKPFKKRIAALGCASDVEPLVEKALAEEGWRAIAALDAAVRMTAAIVESDGLARGREAGALVSTLFDRARRPEVRAAGAADAPKARKDEVRAAGAADAAKARNEDADAVPAPYWTARPNPDAADEVLLRGAVLVRIGGPEADGAKGRSEAEEKPPLSPELVAALDEKPARPARALLRFLREDGVLSPAMLFGALAASVLATGIEAVLFRSLFEIGSRLGLFQQRLGAMIALVAFGIALLALEIPLARGWLRLGRHLETRMRIAFLEKMPRLVDRYFQSRPTSDMAERSHAAHVVRVVPELGGTIVRTSLDLVVTTCGIAWIDPKSAPLAALAALVAIGVPVFAQPVLAERDLRARSHGGALMRFVLDALLGLVPVRTHGAERAVRREHEALLVEWARASRALLRAAVTVETLQSLAVYAVVVPLVLLYVVRMQEPAGVLLLLYWALALPASGEELAVAIRQYPSRRNTTLRLLEPLGALEEAPGARSSAGETRGATPLVRAAGAADGPKGTAITFEGVSVVAAGHTILEGVDLAVEPGSHVAVVGASGAGKSSLVGTLLGWLRPASGRVLVDGAPLDGDALATLRRHTAWIDPAVQIWNRALLDNLRYGSESASASFADALAAADLHRLVETLPDGLQTALGESGALVSGGEGQRVRFGRALLRGEVRLAIFDEPFRGLDREKRRTLLANARAHWKDATLLCVTHDVGETRGFDRVVVIDGGRVVEDGSPAELAGREDSLYRRLLDAEESLFRELWMSGGFRRLRLERGTITTQGER